MSHLNLPRLPVIWSPFDTAKAACTLVENEMMHLPLGKQLILTTPSIPLSTSAMDSSQPKARTSYVFLVYTLLFLVISRKYLELLTACSAFCF